MYLQIPLPPVDEKKKVVEDVDKDRRYAIDASIVRIMKSRKALGHQQLVLECVEQLNRMFKVLISVDMFKICCTIPYQLARDISYHTGMAYCLMLALPYYPI